MPLSIPSGLPLWAKYLSHFGNLMSCIDVDCQDLPLVFVCMPGCGLSRVQNLCHYPHFYNMFKLVQKMMQSIKTIASLFENMFKLVQRVMKENQIIAFKLFGLACHVLGHFRTFWDLFWDVLGLSQARLDFLC